MSVQTSFTSPATVRPLPLVYLILKNGRVTPAPDLAQAHGTLRLPSSIAPLFPYSTLGTSFIPFL